jgi:predicted RND superfamily exporter protein
VYADFDGLECVLAGIPTGLSASMMALVLGVLLRRVGGIVMPLLVVVLSLLSTLGIMVLLEIPGSTAVQILPISLLTVGVCDAVHILAMAYRLRSVGKTREEAIAHALGHSGLAVVMTSVTTGSVGSRKATRFEPTLSASTRGFAVRSLSTS